MNHEGTQAVGVQPKWQCFHSLGIRTLHHSADSLVQRGCVCEEVSSQWLVRLGSGPWSSGLHLCSGQWCAHKGATDNLWESGTLIESNVNCSQYYTIARLYKKYNYNFIVPIRKFCINLARSKKTHKRFKRTLTYYDTTHNLRIFGIIPSVKLQNNTFCVFRSCFRTLAVSDFHKFGSIKF